MKESEDNTNEIKENSEDKKSNSHPNSSLNDDMSFSQLDNSIINKLLEFGYEYKTSKKLISLLNPRDVQHAIEYLSVEDGIIQHVFIDDLNQQNICSICSKPREEHLNENNNFNNNDMSDNISSFSRNTNNNLNEESSERQSSKSNTSISKTENYESKSVSIKEFSISEGETEKQICTICEDEYDKSKQTQLENCQHTFCKTCWLNYLKININEKKQIKIKCMNHLCDQFVPEKFIYIKIKNNKDLILQYNENKLRNEVINNPRKKFCPYPDCKSYARRNGKEEINVKCGNGHSFCFYCLQAPHDNGKCERKIDEKMEEYAKKKFIKKCPNCGTWTQKNKGCNHMTCIECNHQWCWLCNKKYTNDHYSSGKCKGFQFFQPKNEEEIQLAFDGKIDVREDDDDLPIYHYIIITVNDPPEQRIISISEKIILLLIFFIFGYIITIICQSGKYLNRINISRGKISFLSIMYFFLVILFGLTIFIFQIFNNFIIFIMIIINNNLSEFFDDFGTDLRKFKNLVFFENYGGVVLENIYKYIVIILSLFSGCPFWVLNIMNEKNFYRIGANKTITNKIFIIFYIFTIFLFFFTIYPISLLLNIIGIIFIRAIFGNTSLAEFIEVVIKYQQNFVS